MQVVHSLPASFDNPARQTLCIRLARTLLQLFCCILLSQVHVKDTVSDLSLWYVCFSSIDFA